MGIHHSHDRVARLVKYLIYHKFRSYSNSGKQFSARSMIIDSRIVIMSLSVDRLAYSWLQRSCLFYSVFSHHH